MHDKVCIFYLFLSLVHSLFSYPYFLIFYLVCYREEKRDTEVGPDAKEEAKL